MTCSVYNYGLGSNSKKKKKSLNPALPARVECSVPLVGELPPFPEKAFPIYFSHIFIFLNCPQFYSVARFKETVSNVYNDTDDFMYSRGNK